MNKLFSAKRLRIFIPIILTLFFFLPNIVMGKIPIPGDTLVGLYNPFRDKSFLTYGVGKFPVKNPLITDPVLQTYPWRYITIDNFKNASLPLWNPYNFLGQPLLANSQSSPFQVANILFFIFPFKIAWDIQIILSLLLTSLFMYLFLESLRLLKVASVFGAFVLPFSGFFIVWLTWGTIVTTAMWLPLVLFCINKLFERISPLIYLLLIFAVSQTILSGHLQTALYILMSATFYIIYIHLAENFGIYAEDESKRIHTSSAGSLNLRQHSSFKAGEVYKLVNSGRLKSAIVVVSGLILGILISAFQVIPTLEFINLSARSIDQAYKSGRQDWFIPFQNLIQLVSPDYFGNPATYNYWGIWNYAEFVGYIGIFPLFFAGLALIERKRKYLFFVSLGVLSLMLSLENPISKLPYLHSLPFISSMQPSRIIFLLVFCLTVMSAAGLDLFLKNKLKKNYAIFLLIFVFVVFAIFAATFAQKGLFPTIERLDPQKIALRNLIIPTALALLALGIAILKDSKISKGMLITAIFLITLFDLFRFAGKFTPFVKPSLIFPETKTIDFLTSQEKPFRIMTTDRVILHPNSNAVYKIESVDGYDPLFLKDYAKLVSSWNADNISESGSFNRIVIPQNYQSKIADLLNVKYLLSLNEISDPKLAKVLEEGETKVYINKNVLPRAFFASEVVKVATQDQQLQYLFNSGFDVKTSAVSSEFSYPKQNLNSNVRFDNYSDQNFTLSVFSEKEAPLIVSNPFYPGWKAYVDGIGVSVNRVDFMFQSILVPAGNHQVEFKFSPKSFYNGFYLSLIGLLLSILITATLWRKKYQ